MRARLQAVARTGKRDCGRRQRREAPSGATFNFSCPKLELQASAGLRARRGGAAADRSAGLLTAGRGAAGIQEGAPREELRVTVGVA